jgi:signal transduction histidine kinase
LSKNLTRSLDRNRISTEPKNQSFINLDRVTDLIGFQKEKLWVITRDRAVRDDTYQFMADRDPVYAQNNLDIPISTEDLRIDGVLYFDSKGKYVDSRWYDLRNGILDKIPGNIRQYFDSNAFVLNNSVTNTDNSGFILLSDGPYLVAMHQILPSNGKGPSRGTIVMVQRYDTGQIIKLQDQVQIPVNLTPIDERVLKTNPVVLQLTAAGAPDHISRIYNSSALISSTIVPDLEGKPVLLLEVTTARSIYEKALETVAMRLLIFLIIAASFVVIAALLLRMYIINPLTDLDSALAAIGHNRDLSKRFPVSGDDEITSLKHSLNAMLQELEDSHIQLAAQGAQLEEANRKANLYLEIYLDVMSYEILNAMFSLHGYLEIMNKRAGNTESDITQSMIEIIKKSQNIIKNIQIISKIYKHPPEQEPVKLNDVLEKEIKANIGITIRCRNCDVVVLADEMLLVIFRNLFSNSIKFGGKTVEIDVIVDNQEDGTLLISVSDTGKGIPDESKQTIFDRFIRDSDKRSSYGLGLHIVKMLVEAYGGRIWADDRVPGHPEQGAAIRFTLKKG